MKTVNVAIIGCGGWMGRTHAMAYQTVPHFFRGHESTAEVKYVVDEVAAAAEDAAKRLPNATPLTEWQTVVNDPSIDLIDICLPDSLHFDVAKAALEAGKHVYCEKPLTENAKEAQILAELAREKGVITRVGHGFMRNPVHDLAKELIDGGEIGDITMVKATQHVDSFGDPSAPWIWRADGNLAPTGIVGDTGAHVFSILDRLVGQVDSLIADNRIFTTQRPKVDGFQYGGAATLSGDEEYAEVSNTDATNIIMRFENGASGLIDFSRTATGRKFTQRYEIYGTRGAIIYDYDQINRLQFYTNDDPVGKQGFRAIDVGPERDNYGAFLPLPNFALGYNETKIIEAAEVIQSVDTGEAQWPTFDNGLHIAQLVDACFLSSERRSWVSLSETLAQ